MNGCYSVPPWGRVPRPAWAGPSVRRCKWCGDLVHRPMVVLPDHRAKRLVVGVEPHPDGKIIVSLSDGSFRLIRGNSVAHGEAFLVHSEWDCAVVLRRDQPDDAPFPEPAPRTLAESIIKQEVIRALERSGL